ncbi:MAG: elongation factor P [Patescibacteria group bacterium]|nr:elongation factor P [Patescibacteria group bacterium]
MALDYTELKKGLIIVLNGEPYEILESGFLRMQQRKAVMQTKLKSLISGKVIDRNFQPSDEIEEAEINRIDAIFIYQNKGEYWFYKKDNPKERFALKEDILGNAALFLKPNIEIQALSFNDKIIQIKLPVKMEFEVVEAPPAIRGNTAQGGSKQVVIETGAKISVPLFVETGDIIRVNTETGEYVERVDKK